VQYNRRLLFRRIGCGLAGLLFTVTVVWLFVAAKGLARLTSCGANLRQVGTSTLMYTQDWDERLPPFAQWMDRTQPYSRTWVTYHCTEVNQSKEFGYGLNDGISQVSKIPRPHEYPLLYESQALQKNAYGPFPRQAADPLRHRAGGIWIVYASGQSKVLYRRGGTYQPATRR
jgi:hypothetical protein